MMIKTMTLPVNNSSLGFGANKGKGYNSYYGSSGDYSPNPQGPGGFGFLKILIPVLIGGLIAFKGCELMKQNAEALKDLGQPTQKKQK